MEQNVSNELGLMAAQLPISMWVAWLIQAVKDNKHFVFMTTETGTLNKMVAIIMAFVTSAGLNYSFEGSLVAGMHFELTVPPVATLLHFLIVDVARAYGTQLAFYKAVLK